MPADPTRQRRPASRWWQVAAGVAVVIAAATVGFALWIASLDANAYRGTIENAVEDATGRDLTIQGPIALRFGLPIRIAVDDVTLANASWGSRPDMARLSHVAFKVHFWPLLLSEVRLAEVAIAGLDLLLETDAAGQGNWIFDKRGAAPGAPATPPTTPATPTTPTSPGETGQPSVGGGKEAALTTIESLTLKQVAVTYRNSATGKETFAIIDDLSLQSAAPGGPLAVALAARIAETPLSVTGTIGPAEALLLPRAGEPYPLALQAETLGVRAWIEGTVADIARARGLDLGLALEAESLEQAAFRLGISLPSQAPVRAKAHLSDPDSSYVFDGIEATAGRSDLSGRITLTLGRARPRLTAILTSSTVYLDDLRIADKKPSGEGASRGSSGDGWRVIPDSPLPLQPMQAVDAEVSAQIGTLVLPSGLSLRTVAMSGQLIDGNLNSRTEIADVAGGRAGIDLAADARLKLLDLALALKEADLGQILDAFVGKGLINGGALDVAIDVKGSGASVRDVLAKADGTVRIDARGGELRKNKLDLGFAGADVAKQLIEAIDPVGAGPGPARLDCAVVRGPIKRGVVVLDRGLALETNKMGVSGTGEVDLATEGLDLAVRAKAREGLGVSVAGIASSFIRIRGTLAAPSIAADPLDAVEGAARAGVNVLTGLLKGQPRGLADLLRADPAPCRTALGLAPQASGSRGGTGGPGIGAPTEGAIKSIERGVKGLFGR